MELASLIISIFAIFLSLFVAIWQNKCSKAINDINLEADLLKELITKPLTEEIPNAYKDLCFPTTPTRVHQRLSQNNLRKRQISCETTANLAK